MMIRPLKQMASLFFSFKTDWRIMGDGFIKAIHNFFRTRGMLREVNATCIALVPKHPSPTSLGDYRHIACCGVVYKCITKILSNRMRFFIPEVISLNQLAFVQEVTYRI